MRGTIESTSTMLSRNNLQRSSATQPAPIRRSDSSRIETWRDEVNVCFSAGSSIDINSPPGLSEKDQYTGKLSKVKSKVFKRRSTTVSSSGKDGDVTRTSMYDGDRPGERMMDEWEEGGGESMYFGSMGKSEGGRLDRAEQLLNRGFGEGQKKVEIQQAAA
jgi:hypothetical protein